MRTIILTTLISLFYLSAIAQPDFPNSYHVYKDSNNVLNKYQIFSGRVKTQDFKKVESSISSQQITTKSSFDNIVQHLDSIIYEENDELTNMLKKDRKQEFYYDSNGMNIKYVDYEWDSMLDEWIIEDKEEYKYDSNGHLIELISYGWNKNLLNNWEILGKRVYRYDNKGNNTHRFVYVWNDTEQNWIGLHKEEYFFDNNGNCTLHVLYSWNENVKTWIGTYKREDSYDINNNQVQMVISRWDLNLNQWVTDRKHENKYDAFGKLTSEIVISWIFTNNSWLNSTLTEHKYDSKGNKTESRSYHWNSTLSMWDTSNKFEYTYDSNQNLIKESMYTFDNQTKLWKEYSRIECDYDSFSNQIKIVGYFWDDALNKLATHFSQEYTYDNSFSYEDLILPTRFFLESENESEGVVKRFRHKLTLSSDYVKNQYSGQLYLNNQWRYYYSLQTITGIEKPKLNEAKIYPNPSMGLINVDLSGFYGILSFEIFDIFGNRQYITTLSQNMQINLDHLPKGVYVFQITNNQFIQSGKIILR